ncbi:MAG: hypothetical protein K8S21_11325 [Gemmatimonadetes bacterium]|nr:hypothetical protein [Gemmatimonadota bacterium]
MTRRYAHRAALVVLTGVLAACEIPSEAPILQQTWIVPGDSVAVTVAQILPTNVLLTSGGTAFAVTIPSPSNFSATLGTLCGQPACQSGATVSAPVPAFTSGSGVLTTTVTLPAGVTSATVSGGTLNLSILNNLGFDPLRPNGAVAPFGSFAVTLTSGATTSTTTFVGSSRTMTNAATTAFAVPLPLGVYTGSIAVSVAFTVPAGGSALLSAANSLSISASVGGLTLTQATVVVASDPVNTAPSAFDLEGADFADQVESGGLLLDIVNPFTASATMNVVIAAPAQLGSGAVSITKALVIPATPTSTATIDLTKADLQSLLGKSNVTMAVNGTATGTGAGNTVTVTPTQQMTLRTRVRLVLNVGA